VLQCATFSHPISSLPKISPCSLGVGGWPLGCEDVGLIVREISFQDFQPMWSWSTNVTNRRTDDMRSEDRALHYSASRGKNSLGGAWQARVSPSTSVHLSVWVRCTGEWMNEWAISTATIRPTAGKDVDDGLTKSPTDIAHTAAVTYVHLTDDSVLNYPCPLRDVNSRHLHSPVAVLCWGQGAQAPQILPSPPILSR